MNDSELLTVRELAEKLKVSGRTVQQWTAEGVIPSLKIGKIRRYLWSEVLAVLVGSYHVHESGGPKKIGRA